jgi:hypothetical protein
MGTIGGWIGGLGRLLLCGLALAALLAGAAPARAQAGLKAEMAEAAKKIAVTLGNNSVRIGDFTGPKNLQASGGPGIAKALTDALKKAKVKIDNNAPRYTIDGEFSATTDRQTGRLAVQVDMRLKENGNVQFVFSRAIFPKDAKDTSIQDLLGVSTSLGANDTDEERDARIREALKDPSVTINGTRVSARAKSPYAIEVLVKDGNDYVARTPESVRGRAFVRLKKDEVYAVRLVNNTNFDCACTLSIDGINVFALSEVKDATGDVKFQHVIMRKKSATTIKGWFITTRQTKEFLVTDLKDAAGGAIRSSSAVGTITASFAVAVAKGSPLPADEPKTRAVDESATGVGAELGTNFSETERTFGVVRETISVRYSK